MSDTSGVAAGKTTRLPNDEIERAAKFAREPILLEGESPDALVPGSARRLAVEAAIAELDEGRETPSPEWRRHYSLVLGLERLLDTEPPKLVDGAELNEHQVDALSGTLAALVTEIEDPGAFLERTNGNGARSEGSEPAAEVAEVVEATNGAAPNGDELDPDEEEDELDPDEEPQDWEEPPTAPTRRSSRRLRRTPAPAAASGSSTRPAPARPSPPSASSTPRAPAAP